MDFSARQKNIVILGGSYGGVSTAHYLLKHVLRNHLFDKDLDRILLISASSKAMCRPACPRAMLSDDMFPQEKLFVSIPESFKKYPKGSFHFIHGIATELNPANRTVSISLPTGPVREDYLRGLAAELNDTKRLATIHLSGSILRINYHVLVIATGASTPSPLHGLNRDADDLRTSWQKFRSALPTANSIVIAGGGPAGVETAGELGEYLNGHGGRLGRTADPKVSITVVTTGPHILPFLRLAVAEKAERYLAAVGVTVIKNARVKRVKPEGAGRTDDALTSKTTVILEDGRSLEADLYIPATGTIPNTKFIPKPLLTSDGRVVNDPLTLHVRRAGSFVYAVGDVATYSRPAIHLILKAIPILCQNIERDLILSTEEGRLLMAQVKYEYRIFEEDTRETQLVPIGRTKGVGTAMGWSLPSPFVWLFKGRDYWLWTTASVWSGRQWWSSHRRPIWEWKKD
ncbi:MAG: hypothetical protein Q9182_001540 [Xanthomendoza sp. 2 TL-2023]